YKIKRKDDFMLVEIKKMNKEEVTVVTSLDVAETFEKNHRDVMESIRNIGEAISTAEFSALFYLDSYKASNGKTNPMYLMTRDGFTLLAMGYNGDKAMKFKLAYIKQFNEMEKVLIGKQKEREKGIAVRQALTNALQQSQENERMHGHAYSTYTNIVYKAVFGKDAKRLREEYGISKKENLRECFSEEERKAVQSVEMIVSGLVNCGWGYEQIKEFVMNQNLKMLAA
ncbi:Rha family transcriptional regulator, partial [Blautia sp. OF01-4LB]|uniref:Rha family transcriptional regulator n=2 Tax=unclassified Blautia TaxID=2648079 RepID=UPI002E8DFB51